MIDALVVRTAGAPEEVRAFAVAGLPVISATTADEHPTQALADLTTLAVRFGTVDNLRVLYLGEGNNTAAALALALPRFAGTQLQLRTSPGYGIDPLTLATATTLAESTGSQVVEQHNLDDLPDQVDVVYTSRWQTTGTTKADPGWRRVFAPFRVDRQLMDRYPGAWFMHDLPAHRDEDMVSEVLDGPASIAFKQARHKLQCGSGSTVVHHWRLDRRVGQPELANLHAGSGPPPAAGSRPVWSPARSGSVTSSAQIESVRLRTRLRAASSPAASAAAAASSRLETIHARRSSSGPPAAVCHRSFWSAATLI